VSHPTRTRLAVESLDSRCLPSGNPAISISDVSLAEGGAGRTAFVFTVSLSEASSREVSVKYGTANGSAKTGSGDFVAKSGTLTFRPGETTKTITVWVNGDAQWELDERFFVNLSRARNATIADAQGVGAILNDDGGGCSADNPCTEPDPNPNPVPDGGGFWS
jgi:chitinase